MKLFKNFSRKTRWAAFAGAACASLALASATLAPSPETSAASKPVLVSNAGNVFDQFDAPSTVAQPTAVFYWGYYDTKAACIKKRDELLKKPGMLAGGCNYVRSGKYAGKWQLWMDEDTCQDAIPADPVQTVTYKSVASRPLASSAA